MKKNYFYITSLFILFSLSVSAQENKDSALVSKQEQPFENLNVYPNPVGNGKVYISSKTSAPKDIEIYDVLGKRVMQTTLTTKELNISLLSPGVYIIKIKEGDQRATRKLIIK
ncbi:MAG: T9SS type A sorting domain-containing protein [Bacteroidota bacterium]